MTPALTKEDRRKLELAGLILPSVPHVPNKGGRPPKVTHIIAPVAATGTFKTTPGPRQGVEYKSPYRHGAQI